MSVNVFSAGYLREVGTRIFVGCGAPPDEAALVAEELVDASLMGLDSHGVIRYIEYVMRVREGKTRPGAPVRVVKETPTTAIVDCGFNFGAVSASRMVEIACEKAASQSIACVVSRNSTHIGRLGGYAQKVAERGLFCIATCNSSKHGHWVVPFGGKEGRLATNPMAFAAPTSGLPVVLDMSTSAISEGKIRLLMAQGKEIPSGYCQDAEGNPCTDPEVWYGPPKGTILPFGHELGYKGYGLSLLVEIMGGIMAGEASTEDGSYVNGFALIAVDPEAFCGREKFVELMDNLCSYHRSCPPAPGFTEVVLPGTYDFRMREKRLKEGIPVTDVTWKQIKECAATVGVTVPEPEESLCL
ncbi:MAG: Ldh family oxidoreductase [Armatimonadetes bacterium]|nr:Ldh family oxidoreductase [Armatimonadota bacterium]